VSVVVQDGHLSAASVRRFHRDLVGDVDGLFSGLLVVAAI
jgi:hypothetical protein